MENKPGKSTAEKIREWIQFALLLIASAWGIYTFIYKEIIAPANRPASLQISGNLEEVGRTENLIFVRARIHLNNTRDTKIYVPAVWFTVTGLEIHPWEPSTEGEEPPLTQDGLSVAIASYSEQSEDLVASWRLEDWQLWYEPNDESYNDYLFYVPVNTYEAIQLRLLVFFTRSIDEIASVEWDLQNGVFVPTIMMKGILNLPEPFDSEHHRQHKEWADKSGAGLNWFVTTLSLLHTDQGTQTP